MSTKNQFTAVYKKTKDCFIAWVLEIPGVNTQGKTLAETRKNLREALILVLGQNKKVAYKDIEETTLSRHELISVKIPA